MGCVSTDLYMLYIVITYKFPYKQSPYSEITAV
jgi:hypothetical protein